MPGLVCAAALTGILALAPGCGGGGERQDENEVAGDFPVEVVKASFPRAQSIGETTTLRLTVGNTGQEVVPNVAVTIEGFATRLAREDASDPSRPAWVVNQGPEGADTALVGTWALGPLPAGEERTFAWQVTAVRSGTHTLRYRVGAGLDGKARAVSSGGDPVDGSIVVRVTRRPRDTVVDPETGDVVERSELQQK